MNDTKSSRKSISPANCRPGSRGGRICPGRRHDLAYHDRPLPVRRALMSTRKQGTGRRAAAALLAFLLLALSACAGKGGEAPGPDGRGEALSDRHFTRERLLLPGPDLQASLTARAGDGVILVAWDAERHNRLCRLDLSSWEISLLSEPLPGLVQCLDAGSDGSVRAYWLDEEGRLCQTRIGPDGAAAEGPVPLPPELTETDVFLYEIRAVGEGALLYSSRGLLLVGADGTLQRDYQTGSDLITLLRCGDDSLLVVSERDERATVRLLQADGTLGEGLALPDKYDRFLPGEDGETLYGLLGGTLFHIDRRSGARSPYAELGAASVGYGFLPLSWESFLTTDRGVPVLWRLGEAGELVTLSLASCSALDAFHYWQLRDVVNAFNESQTGTELRLVDYSAYDTHDDPMAGIKRLGMDIIGGNAPDLIDLDCLATVAPSARLFENLRPYFDAEEDLSYEELLPGVRRVLERDGGLYELVPSFTVSILCGPASVVGDGSHWGLADFFALVEQYGVEKLLGLDIRREDFLGALLVSGSRDFVDYGAATCRFDSEDFIRMLELIKQLPTERSGLYTLNEVYHGRQLLSYYSSGNAFDPLFMFQVTNGVYHGGAVPLGFPSDTVRGALMTPTLRLGMSAGSIHKDEAWSFLRYLLQPAYQYQEQFVPVLSGALEERFKAWVLYGSYKIMGGIQVSEDSEEDGMPVEQATEETVRRVRQILDSLCSTNRYDAVLYDIIMEELAPFFAGDKTAAQAAASIQSRASVYLAEQYA